ncbi:hypothetical protein WJX84_005044 [Apatococcus fuscideae]|uniref:Uncharacterized protein n=1 Tax=Apatococcus fuscideae TaxID=2026836 RepID=A0AAW1T067_9CHLO
MDQAIHTGPFNARFVADECLVLAVGPAGAANVAEPMYKRIVLLEPTGDEDNPFRGIKFQNMTPSKLCAIVRPLGVMGLIARQDLPERLELLDEDLLTMDLDSLELEEGGQYLPTFLGTNLTKSVSQEQKPL